ncbi:MAG: DUF4065 domain-containing protein [Turicibacter sp.]|nr:DUF4065 domain-containing protein [Turicibacter sp.]
MTKKPINLAYIIANSILEKAFAENIAITPMKLQKLLYFTYKRYLQETDTPMFEEYFEVWTWGPVLPSVYKRLKDYRLKGINDYIRENNSIFVVSDKEKAFHKALDWVWYHYSEHSPSELSDITHAENSAWSKAKEAKNLYIDDDDIKEEQWLLEA